MIAQKNGNCRTITNFVDQSLENSAQFQNASAYTVLDGYIIEDYNLFRDRYFDDLMSYTEKMVMTDEELKKYKYRPKRLSLDLYGTIDYWYIILMLNKMTTMLQFTKPTILVLNSSGIRYIKSVLQREESRIQENKVHVNKLMSEYSTN